MIFSPTAKSFLTLTYKIQPNFLNLSILTKICKIEVYLLTYYLKATLYINDAIRDKQSIKYYGILRRYN